jgi:hypothetical protein
MEATVTGRNRDRQFRIFEVFGERFALGPIRFDAGSKRDPHAVGDGVNRFHDVAHPGPNSLHFVDHWAADFLTISANGAGQNRYALARDGAVSSPHLARVVGECLPFAINYMRSIVGTATGKTNSLSINFLQSRMQTICSRLCGEKRSRDSDRP